MALILGASKVVNEKILCAAWIAFYVRNFLWTTAMHTQEEEKMLVPHLTLLKTTKMG